MSNVDKEIEKHREALNRLRRLKRKQTKPRKPKSLKPVGRPKIDKKTIQTAKELAKDYPLPDVARTLDVSLSTLYRHNIKRYVLNAEQAKT